MKKLLLIIICSIILCFSSFATTKSKTKINQDLAERRAKDNEFHEYINTLEKQANEENSIEKYALLWTQFECFAPYTNNYNQIKNKIKTKHKITKYKEIKIPTRDGLKLDGWFIPVKNAKATVIVLHGWGSDIEFGLSQSKFLLNLGYQLVLFNARFWNFWNKPKEYVGDFHKDINDIEDVLVFTKKLKGVDENKIGVIGFSKGARKAIIAGAKFKDLKFVIADAAPTHVLEEFTEEQKEMDNKINNFIKEKYGFEILYEESDAYNLVDKISPRPLLLLHGEKDTFVNIKCTQLLYEKAQEPKMMQTFPKTGHCLGMLTSDKNQYFKTVNDFLDNVKY